MPRKKHDLLVEAANGCDLAIDGRLSRSWFRQGALPLAPQLLGQTVVRRTSEGLIRCRIVETESYVAPLDKGSHAYGNRRTKRTETMFQDGGKAYVYLIYGMHYCLNVVAAELEQAEAVLIRAVEPLSPTDVAWMRIHRPIRSRKTADISNGPGKLCAALQIDKQFDGADLVMGKELWIERGIDIPYEQIVCATRINIPYAEEYADKLWRFYIAGNPYVSVVDKQAVPLSNPARLLETFQTESGE
ncbi:DNA-3-methyladenine glycosylase [Paenibacillus taiwanensis]|uniref:DNA-3-methyladenine glycosylase n=1 Tax=Paenibacillus taiwanensis TaxID=401638 RepID=UPI0003FE79C5|nr:DNA-3-methyladenine glycosylase [Paenibacillus taiwanensis]